MDSTRKKILFKISGSIAAYKACDLISTLVQSGHEVQTVVSPEAFNFVGEATLEGLTRRQVMKSTFSPSKMMSHIDFVKWCDLVLLCPATANTVNKMAAGVADNLLLSLFLAHDFSRPYVVACAMNTKMYQHPATQRSLTTLRNWGLDILSCDTGSLACGEWGEGRMLEPKEILLHLYSSHYLPNHPENPTRRQRKILITSGATCEPIDSIRFLSNRSTGKTGAQLADYFFRRGDKVDLLHGRWAMLPRSNVEQIVFDDFSDLKIKIQKMLAESEYDVIIHAAAVSDYTVKDIWLDGKPNGQHLRTKIPSGHELCLNLTPTQKLIADLKKYSRRKNPQLIGFKFTDTLDISEQKRMVDDLFKGSAVDVVVHNDLSQISNSSHAFTVYDRQKASIFCSSYEQLAHHLDQYLQAALLTRESFHDLVP